MDLGAIAEAKLAHELETLYLGLFRQHHGADAHLEQQDRNVFYWLAASFPEWKSKRIVEAYFRVTDPFIVKKRHPVKSLKTEINQVLPLVKEPTPSKGSSAIMMKIPLSCDKCGKYFDWIGTAEQLERTRLCSDCKGV